MKRLLSVCICLLCCIGMGAQGTIIQISNQDKAEQDLDTRSLPTTPTVTHDGSTIYIFSYIPLENLQVTVKDTHESVVYSNIVSIPARQCYSFILNNAEKEEYIIEISYEEEDFYGTFWLE